MVLRMVLLSIYPFSRRLVRGGSFYLRFKNDFYDTLDNVNLTKLYQVIEELIKLFFGKCYVVSMYRRLDN